MLDFGLGLVNYFIFEGVFVVKLILNFDNDDKIDDVLLEHGRLPHVLPLAVHLRFFSLIDK